MSHFPYPPLSAYIAVNNAAEAITFYKKAFGAEERYSLKDSTTGKIGHAELLIESALLMLSEEMPGWNKSPKTLGGTTAVFCLMVKNADVAIEKAVAAGATVVMPAADQFYGFRSGHIRDPYGHEWMLQHEVENVSPEEMQKRWDGMISDCKPT
ncbi:MAG: VOC family protein [Luteolibacter sp.]